MQIVTGMFFQLDESFDGNGARRWTYGKGVGQGGKGEERDGDPSEGGGHDGTTIDSSLRRTAHIARSKLNVTISPLKKFI